MKILVTGGCGYVGSNLIKKLLDYNNSIQAIDIDTDKGVIVFDHFVTYLNLHTEHISTLDGDFDLVYHLGEYSRVAPSFDEPDVVFDQNIKGSFEVLEYCRVNNIPIIYAASSTKMAQEGPGHSPYSFFKSTIVDLIRNYGRWYGLQYSICYFYNVYGKHWSLPDPDSKWNTVVSIFEKQWMNGQPITICGDGLQERDFTHIDDIVEGLVRAGKYHRLSSFPVQEEYQFGSGEKLTIRELAELYGGDIKYIEGRPGDRKTSLADISNAEDKLAWTPKKNLREYVRKIKELAELEEKSKLFGGKRASYLERKKI